MLTWLGIGRAIALAFATAGYQGIAIADRLAEGLAQTQELIAKEAPNAAVETIVNRRRTARVR
jgi:hypothetical protein